MKKLILTSCAFLLLSKSFSQNPDLFQTWYLTDYYLDLGGEYEVSDIDPPISPTLIITEVLEFSGEGACNSFTGIFGYDSNDRLIVENFDTTLLFCDFQVHNDFEIDYFFFFQEFELFYSIENVGGGEQILSLDGASSGMNFSNNALSVSDNKISNFKIHPNPTANILNITSKNPIQKLAVISVSGMRVLEQNFIENSIDVSSLQNGIYFLEISSREGKSIQKFIKK